MFVVLLYILHICPALRKSVALYFCSAPCLYVLYIYVGMSVYKSVECVCVWCVCVCVCLLSVIWVFVRFTTTKIPRFRDIQLLITEKIIFINPASIEWKPIFIHASRLISSFYLRVKLFRSIELLFQHRNVFINPTSSSGKSFFHQSSFHFNFYKTSLMIPGAIVE